MTVQETKTQTISGALIKNLWGNRECDWAFIPAIGASGDILTIWDTQKLEKLDELEGAYTLSIKLRNRGNKEIWKHTNVYAPIGYVEKQDFWNELAAAGGIWDNEAWCISGDFNKALS